MPLTVITLKNSTPSLRGDLSKWMQEIATGVYIGNFNSRIREYLWTRVLESVGNGEATLSYASRNEIGYNFETYNTKRKTIDFEGIPLVIFPNESNSRNIETGFSKAAKYRKKRKFSVKTEKNKFNNYDFVIIDIETTGLDFKEDEIIEVGALKVSGNEFEEFNDLVTCQKKVPEFIVNLTGITDELLDNWGVELKTVLEGLKQFIGKKPILGYNVNFDIKFINHCLKNLNMEQLQNNYVDVLSIVKNRNMYLDNYKLETVLCEYGIKENIQHRALSDAKQILELINKLNDIDS